MGRGSERVWLGGSGRTNEFDDGLLAVRVRGRWAVCSLGDVHDVVGSLFCVMLLRSDGAEAVDIELLVEANGGWGTELVIAFGETGDANIVKAGLVIMCASESPTATLVAMAAGGGLGEEPLGPRLGPPGDSRMLAGRRGVSGGDTTAIGFRFTWLDDAARAGVGTFGSGDLSPQSLSGPGFPDNVTIEPFAVGTRWRTGCLWRPAAVAIQCRQSRVERSHFSQDFRSDAGKSGVGLSGCHGGRSESGAHGACKQSIADLHPKRVFLA
jgi:hypothetical protein